MQLRLVSLVTTPVRARQKFTQKKTNIIIVGDSGAGKSETLEALKNLLNEEQLFLYFTTIDVLKEMEIIKESGSEEYYFQTKTIKDKNTFNRLAYKKYKEMFGIMPDKTPYFRLITFILDEECIPA